MLPLRIYIILYFHCFGVAALAIGPSSHVNGPHNVGKVNSFHERQMRSFSGIFMISESQLGQKWFLSPEEHLNSSNLFSELSKTLSSGQVFAKPRTVKGNARSNRLRATT